MKKYILIGSNNFWFALDTSLSRVKKQAKEILQEDQDNELNDYSDPETDRHPFVPNSIIIYEVKEIDEYQLKE